VRAVLELAAQAVGGVRVAHDEAALGRRDANRDPAHDGAVHEHGRPEDDPDREHRLAVEVGADDRRAREPDHQREEGGDLEQGGRLVQCRLTDQVLVAVVQPHDLARDDDQRDRDEQDLVEVLVRDERDPGDERDRRGQGVAQRESAAVDRVAAAGAAMGAPLGDIDPSTGGWKEWNSKFSHSPHAPLRRVEARRYEPHPCGKLSPCY
jgi:hypothetical protein